MKSLKKLLLVLLFSPLFLVAQAPDAPSNLTLSAVSSTSTSLSWQDNSSNESGFKIFRNNLLIFTTQSDITSFVDSGLSPNTTYTYILKATDGVIGPFEEIKSVLNNQDATYICVGDSTRAGPLSPFDNPASPYDGKHVFDALKATLDTYNTTSYLYAKHGQEAKQFNLETRSPTWQDVVNIIPNDGAKTVVDISLAINDLWSDANNDLDDLTKIATIKQDLTEAINKIKLAKPNTHFMLTMPNRQYNTNNVETSNAYSSILRTIYLELANDLQLPLVNVIDDIMPTFDDINPNWYQDDPVHFHLTPSGQQLVSDLILTHIQP